ncbi:MAG: MFS transporter, partial [Myxococcales bacterium]|nr:MFS transporter [Myxococcales bacterium]
MRTVTFTVLTIVGLSAFEGLAVVAALPRIAADLGSVELLPWVVSAYMLTSGVATVAAGALVDKVGVGPVFRVAVSLFVLGSALCGFAPDIVTLVFARALQGMGAGASNAVGLSSVGLVFPRKLVGRAFAANANVWGVMSVAGPALAALLLTVASWRWIFYLNLPLGGLALLFGWRALPGRRDKSGGRPLRLFDLGLLAAFSIGALVTVDLLDWRSAISGVATLAVGAWLLARGKGKPNALIAPRHATKAPLGPLEWGVSALPV